MEFNKVFVTKGLKAAFLFSSIIMCGYNPWQNKVFNRNQRCSVTMHRLTVCQPPKGNRVQF